MRVFAEKEIREYFAHQINGLDQEIQKEYQSLKNNIMCQAETVNKDVTEFNAGLPDYASTAISKRKKEHLSRLSTLEAIGVPLKRSGTRSLISLLESVNFGGVRNL